MRDKRGASAVPEHSPGTKQSLHVTCEAIHQHEEPYRIILLRQAVPVATEEVTRLGACVFDLKFSSVSNNMHLVLSLTKVPSIFMY
jgi:hypothetical protein